MSLLNQNQKKGNKKDGGKNKNNAAGQSKFIAKGSKPAGGGVNKKGLTGGSRGS